MMGQRSNDQRGFQIGPRIRIGGSVGKLGQKAKIGVGKALSNKYVGIGLSLVPGVGPGLAAAANAAGNIMDTSDGGIHSVGDVGKLALDAGSVYAGGKLAGGLKSGLGALRSGRGIGSALKTSVGMGGGSGGEIAGVSGGDIAGADPSRFRQIGGFLKDNARTIADYGKLGEGIYDRYQQNQDRKMAEEEYRALAPLRDAGMRGLLDTSRPDVSSIFADDLNPNGRYRRVNVGSRGAY